MMTGRNFVAAVLLGSACLMSSSLTFAQAAAQLTIKNNHEIPFAGGIEMPVNLPDGNYQSSIARAQVFDGMARVFANLNANASTNLKLNNTHSNPFNGPFGITPDAGRLHMQWRNSSIATVDIGLSVIPGSSGNVDDAVRAFTPLTIAWTAQPNGKLAAATRAKGYDVTVTASSFGEGMTDIRTKVTPIEAKVASAYLAIVRRVVAPGSASASLRFNGRVMKGGDSPSTWDRDFWYTRGVDWMRWKAHDLSILSVNGFTPSPTIKHDSTWVESSHFYVWERTRQHGDTTWLISEIAGPNIDQAKSRYMPVTPYASLTQGDTVSLKWRLAVGSNPVATWAESQLRGFAGYRSVSSSATGTTIEIGVPSVSFGTSYFPYSTLVENFDYYRTPGVNSEAFWPTSSLMWTGWKAFESRMTSDMHIIRAMGFENLRLHHLELLQGMKREDALAFLDFITGQAMSLGLHVLIDSEGPDEWISTILARYRDVVTRVEIENEVLIGGIKPSDPARWTSLYNAAKTAAPNAQVFFTGAGNNAMFERLRDIGVPFDRVGLHLYKHGPQWKEAYSSHVLGSAGYASEIGKSLTIGEFNWKDLTRIAPEKRVGEVAQVYESVLSPHAVPEIFEFQLQEALAFNPSVSGSYSRHYEPLGQDRRPKPEGLEAMRIIRKYSSPTAPIRALPIVVRETQFNNDKSSASFTITNKTARTLRLRIAATAFDGLTSKLNSASAVTLLPGASTSGTIALELAGDKRVGTYHHFVRVDYDKSHAWGWGVASKQGAPQFSAKSVLGDRVLYPQGTDVVNQIDWNRPTAVAFGANAAVLELEVAYQLASTLQSATGRAVRVSSIADLPDSIIKHGLVILVGTPTSNGMVPAVKVSGASGSLPGAGLIWLNSANKHPSLLLGGPDAKAVQAAVVELILRYWPTAKDATMRITGMEPGAALGHRAGGAAVDPP